MHHHRPYPQAMNPHHLPKTLLNTSHASSTYITIHPIPYQALGTPILVPYPQAIASTSPSSNATQRNRNRPCTSTANGATPHQRPTSRRPVSIPTWETHCTGSGPVSPSPLALFPYYPVPPGGIIKPPATSDLPATDYCIPCCRLPHTPCPGLDLGWRAPALVHPAK